MSPASPPTNKNYARKWRLTVPIKGFAIGHLANSTSSLSGRTVTLQMEMGHFTGDVARGLRQITPAFELLQKTQIARGIGDAPQGSEDISSVSFKSASDARASDTAAAVPLLENKQGQGMLDIAAKSSDGHIILVRYICMVVTCLVM
ncbi:hypothetical protein NDU88_000442 [Pleurodeles waltl]|uniref:Uncharacterized protein n=1 Tax=Pleurodeles waltl TaxID=8319 RepID=A0AAV7L8D4_PLEWA|nr:hypothetical protein NDU88_000442 [Pleurodeles waltl]